MIPPPSPALISNKKSQNYVKAAIAFVCTSCKRQLLFAILQLITFVCTTAFDNFFMYRNCPLFVHYLNCQCLYWILQLRSIVWVVVIKNFCMHYCNFWLTMFVCAITIDIFYTLMNLISCSKSTTFIFTIVFMTRLYSIHYSNCQVLIMYYSVLI